MKPTTHPARLYPQLLGEAWPELAAPLREFHGGGGVWRGVGVFTVRHGRGWLARLLKLPPAGENLPVRLVVTPHAGGESWCRSFDGKPFVTGQSACEGGQMLESIGLMEIRYRLEVSGGALVYRQTRASLRPVSLLRGVPLPRRLSPQIAAREWAEAGEGGTRVSVRVTLPLGGLLVAYDGYVEREESTP